jgi:hypothetical protein
MGTGGSTEASAVLEVMKEETARDERLINPSFLAFALYGTFFGMSWHEVDFRHVQAGLVF